MCQTIPNGRGIGQHLPAVFQRLLLTGSQSGILDLLHLILQQVDLALFFSLIRNQGIQFPLDPHQLTVQGIVLLKNSAVLRIIIQNAQMMRRIEQTHRIVLAVDVDQTAAQLPQNGCRGRHPVDAAAAFTLGGDLAAEQQCFRALVAGLFKLIQHSRRHLLKGGADHRLCSPGAHQVLRGAVAKDRIDGIDQDGFARTGLAGQHIQPRFKVHLRLLDHGNIFNLQAAQHGFVLLLSSLPHIAGQLRTNGLCIALRARNN